LKIPFCGPTLSVPVQRFDRVAVRQWSVFFYWRYDRNALIQHSGKRLGAFYFGRLGSFEMEYLIFQINVNQLATVLFNRIFHNRKQLRFI
jgi:hypothetical protein